jgi:hypothetical protein
MLNGVAFDGVKTIIASDSVNREYKIFELEGSGKKELKLV